VALATGPNEEEEEELTINAAYTFRRGGNLNSHIMQCLQALVVTGLNTILSG